MAWYVLETTTTTVIGYKKIPIFGEPLKLMVVWGWEERDMEMSENGSEGKQAINTYTTHTNPPNIFWEKNTYLLTYTRSLKSDPLIS